MSNISRRQFLKGAGVATLAVAAAGVLAGCSGPDVPDVPDVPGVTTRPVTVIFMKDEGNGVTNVVGETAKIDVLKTEDSVKVADIDKKLLPEGYELENEKAEVEIRNDKTKGGEYVLVFVKKVKTTKTIEVKTFEQPNIYGTATAEVEPDATGVYLNQIKLPAGYIFDPAYNRNDLYSFDFTFVIRKSA